MAELVHFYEGGVTPAGFRDLTWGELEALIGYRDAVVKARKEAAKKRGK